MTTSTGDKGTPRIIAIVAMGPSHSEYVTECLNKSSRWQVADETWAINAAAGVLQHDRAIIMDRLSYFGPAARDENKSLDGYRDWLHKHQGPIYTSELDPDFPGSVLYPLQEVIADLGMPYFNNTCAYALALAIHMRPKMIKLYGMDFTYKENRGFAEAGRACVEYWIAVAISRGIKVWLPKSTTLCDSSLGRPLYGYSNPPDVKTD